MVVCARGIGGHGGRVAVRRDRSGVVEVVLLRWWCLLGSPFAVVVNIEVDVDSRTCACSMFAYQQSHVTLK